MESPKSHAAKLLQSRQGMSRKLMVFVGLALAVVLATTAVLALRAEAMNYTRRELTCAYELHVHTLEECGEPDARTCGLADYVVHMHNDDCYDGDGKLVCPLKEERPHTHDASCREEQKVLICEQDGITEAEAAALAASYDPDHEHTEACYVLGERVLSCGQEEREAHAHTEACYTPGERVLSCGQAEQAGHTHSGDCYTSVLTCSEEHDHADGCYTSELSCGQEEQAGHAHTDACYTDGAPVLSCGQDEHEAHTHTDDCYTEGAPVLTCDKGKEAQAAVPQHVHTDACYETVSELTCGKLELHTHEDECYRIIKPGDPDYETYKQEDTPANEEIRLLICEIPQLEEHVHGGECFTVVELSPDEVAALKAQEAGIELHDLQAIYEDANVRVTVDYDTLSLVPEPAEVALLNANTPLPEPTPNPLLVAEGEPEAAAAEDADMPADAATPEDESAPVDAEPAAGPGTEPAAEPETVSAPEAAPAADENEAPAAAGSSEEPELVRAGLMAEGREWLPAATVTYTVQYLDNGKPIGEAAQYVYTPGGELPAFPRSIARYYRECRTDAFIVTARYTALAQIPEEAELRASIVTDEETISAHEAEYRAALRSEQAQMVSLMDIGFWLNEEEIQPAAPVEITVQLLGEDGLPAGEPITVVHFAAAGTEVLPANVDEKGTASFEMNGFSLIGLGYGPEADEEGRVTLDHTFDWMDENGLFQVTFHVTGIAGPQKEDADDAASGAGAAEAGEPDGENDVADAASDANEEDTAAPADGEETAAGEDENADAEEAGGTEPEAIEPPLANASYMEFTVETLPETDPAYAVYEQHAAGEADTDSLLNLAVMRYALTYNEAAMDLSACEIEVTITPTTRMELGAAAYKLENPADNGDDDGDGYVLAADGETLLPAPEAGSPVLFSVIAPAADSEELLSEQGTLEVGGEQFVEQLKDEDTAMVAEAVFSAAPAAAEEIVPAAVAEPEATEQVITFTIAPRMTSQTAMVRAATDDTIATQTEASKNPEFTVQYYAYIPVVKIEEKLPESGLGALTLIDTSGGKLPKNTGSLTLSPTGNSLKYIYLNEDKQVTTSDETPTRVYQSKNFDFYRAPELLYTNALIRNDHYSLYDAEKDVHGEIWLLRPGKKEDSVDPGDWLVYTVTGQKTRTEKVNGVSYNRVTYIAQKDGEEVELSFTNNPGYNEPTKEGEITFIPLNTYKVIRWVYQVSETNSTFDANFYDYDITTGKVHRAKPPEDPNQYVYKTAGETFSGDSLTDGPKGVLTWAAGLSGWDGHLYAYTKEQGINSSSNYSGSGTKLAFGNVNTGTNLGRLTWSKDNQNNELNKYNNKGYQGCTFGLAAGLKDGKIQYADGINAPKLFNEEGTVTGKTPYNYSLQFKRVGDTYTLTAVNGTVAEKLDTFSNPTNSTGTHTDIWTNNFWPMDSADSFGTGTHDVKFGGTATFKGAKHEIRFGPMTQKGTDYTFPESDDGKYHNSYFGMRYQIDFNVNKDYVGPLEYYFFGDDDMWVFLTDKETKTSQLVCDIGGVHSSVGEYVNLWDYVDPSENHDDHETKSYTLTIFYTERGASGSTCWMQFTLPEATGTEPGKTSEDYGTLQIGKTVTRHTQDGNTSKEEPYDNGESFTFLPKFYSGTQENPNYYSYSLYRDGKLVGDNYSICSNHVFTLKHNEYIVIRDLPINTKYEITEISANAVDKNGKPVESNFTYQTDISGDVENEVKDEYDWDKKVAKGQITAGNKSVSVQYNNHYYVFALPKTGGATPEWYVFGGAALVLAAAVVVRKRRKKARA